MEKFNKHEGISLYIRNIDESVDAARLRKEFSRFGRVMATKVVKEVGKSKGFGFVSYATVEEANLAIAEMNGRFIGALPIYVTMAQRRQDRKALIAARCMAGLTSSRTNGAGPSNQHFALPANPSTSHTEEAEETTQSVRRPTRLNETTVRPRCPEESTSNTTVLTSILDDDDTMTNETYSISELTRLRCALNELRSTRPSTTTRGDSTSSHTNLPQTEVRVINDGYTITYIEPTSENLANRFAQNEIMMANGFFASSDSPDLEGFSQNDTSITNGIAASSNAEYNTQDLPLVGPGIINPTYERDQQGTTPKILRPYFYQNLSENYRFPLPEERHFTDEELLTMRFSRQAAREAVRANNVPRAITNRDPEYAQFLQTEQEMLNNEYSFIQNPGSEFINMQDEASAWMDPMENSYASYVSRNIANQEFLATSGFLVAGPHMFDENAMPRFTSDDSQPLSMQEYSLAGYGIINGSNIIITQEPVYLPYLLDGEEISVENAHLFGLIPGMGLLDGQINPPINNMNMYMLGNSVWSPPVVFQGPSYMEPSYPPELGTIEGNEYGYMPLPMPIEDEIQIRYSEQNVSPEVPSTTPIADETFTIPILPTTEQMVMTTNGTVPGYFTYQDPSKIPAFLPTGQGVIMAVQNNPAPTNQVPPTTTTTTFANPEMEAGFMMHENELGISDESLNTQTLPESEAGVLIGAGNFTLPRPMASPSTSVEVIPLVAQGIVLTGGSRTVCFQFTANVRNAPRGYCFWQAADPKATTATSLFLQRMKTNRNTDGSLTEEMLAAMTPTARRELLGERLYPLVQGMYSDMAGKITGMILELSDTKVLHLLEHVGCLRDKVDEAVAVLKAYEAAKAADSYTKKK